MPTDERRDDVATEPEAPYEAPQAEDLDTNEHPSVSAAGGTDQPPP
jgi:hypothetical protein